MAVDADKQLPGAPQAWGLGCRIGSGLGLGSSNLKQGLRGAVGPRFPEHSIRGLEPRTLLQMWCIAAAGAGGPRSVHEWRVYELAFA
eukprot:1160252-Pelagomonas_calceolata.AAC.10